MVELPHSKQPLVCPDFERHDNGAGVLSPRSSTSSRPSTPTHHSPAMSPPPETVVLALWPHARPDQIDYYVRGYEVLYPSSKIILLHHSKNSIKYIDTVLDDLTDGSEKHRPDQDPDTVIHLFGDDAAAHTCRLLHAYNMRTTNALPAKAIILDSVPIIVAPTLRTVLHAPHTLISFLAFATFSLLWRLLSVLTLWFSEPYREQVRQDLNNPALVPVAARKCYIFPEKDVMFVWQQPGAHRDDDALDRHDFAVERRRVDGVARWTGNQERYWAGIERAWEGGC